MGLEDPARVERLLDACVTWGLVEADGDEVVPSRVWKSWLQKAAEVLNRQVAETGFAPPGHPVRLAVAKALTMKGVPVPDADREDVTDLLTNLELATMTPDKRAQYAAAARAPPPPDPDDA